MPIRMANDERFHRGIAEFNARRFFEAHDVLEEMWHEYREEDRLFLQGLIQVAVGFYHLENRNYNGCRSQFAKAIQKLEPYLPLHQSLDAQLLVDSMNRCLELIAKLQQGEPWKNDEQLIPRMLLLPGSGI